MATILSLTKGDTGPFTVDVPHSTLVNPDGLHAYHTGEGALYFYGKLGLNDADSAAIFKKTLVSGISVTADGNNTDTDGQVSVILDPADTSSLPDLLGAVTVYCSLKGNDGSGHVYTIVRDVRLVVSSQPTSKVS